LEERGERRTVVSDGLAGNLNERKKTGWKDYSFLTRLYGMANSRRDVN
jgi:hypothetical protein